VLARPSELARGVTGDDAPLHAVFTHIEALVELLRIVIVIALRNAHTLLIGKFGLLFRARSETGCKACQYQEAQLPHRPAPSLSVDTFPAISSRQLTVASTSSETMLGERYDDVPGGTKGRKVCSFAGTFEGNQAWRGG
jgi:hypothetical protein